MFFTAVGEMLIMLVIMRPEERMDSEVGMLSWNSYKSDLRNINLSGEHVQISVIRMENCREIRNYLGDHKYNTYLSEIANGIRGIRWTRRHHMELYFEQPGTIYLIVDEKETDTEDMGERILNEITETTFENISEIMLENVNELTRMMQSIGKQLVAEGAETEYEVGILENMGCDYIQGFYFSRPLPEDEFIRYITEQNGSGVRVTGQA